MMARLASYNMDGYDINVDQAYGWKSRKKIYIGLGIVVIAVLVIVALILGLVLGLRKHHAGNFFKREKVGKTTCG